MYGMRTIIPISIGLTRYSSKTFAIINLISAWCWAAITIIPAWYFGEEILVFLHLLKQYWYLAVPFALFAGAGMIYYFNKLSRKKIKYKM